jgi:hypothetical protein
MFWWTRRSSGLALFDALGSPDKQLIGYSGPHAETRPEAVTLWRDFIARHLTHPRVISRNFLTPS